MNVKLLKYVSVLFMVGLVMGLASCQTQYKYIGSPYKEFKDVKNYKGCDCSVNQHSVINNSLYGYYCSIEDFNYGL